VRKADNLTPSCAIFMKSWNHLGHPRPVTGLLFLNLNTPLQVHKPCGIEWMDGIEQY